jgi:hypothetical protein
MKIFPGPRWSVVQQVQQQLSFCDHSLSGSLLVVEPNYLPNLEVCFSRGWTPFPNGGCGGAFPQKILSVGSRGG